MLPPPSARRGQRRPLRLELFEDRLAPAVAFDLSADWHAGFVGPLPVGANLGTGPAVGTIVDNHLGPAPGVADATATEPDGTPMAPGFLRTSGNQIVDASGKTVRLSGVSWFGMEGTTFAPHGLWARNYRDLMDQMRHLGFNHIRLPYSNQLFDAGSTPNGIDFGLNPDLRGLSGLQVMDRVVAYAGEIGLRVILDHHRSDAGAGPQGNGLWHTSAYPESRWIADWRMLAGRYAGNPTVIGADLHNEPHGPATWGGGGADDWRLAAERAGNAVLAVNPDWLVIVEGVQTTAAGSTWWGGNLANAGAMPVRLDVPGRLVYSPHDYPASVYPQPWFSAPDYPQNLYGVWDRYWGYLFRQGTAPILLGEFGSKLVTTSDRQWLDALTTYLAGDLDGNGTNDLQAGQQGPSWTWWSWNPNSGDTGGILQDDWLNVQQAKLDKLEPVQFGATGTTVDNDGSAGVRVGFTVRDDWWAGFVADMSIVNDRATAIDGWTLEFDFDREITNLWNAVLVSHVGTRHVIRNKAWNPVIPAGGRVEFGFQGAPGNVTTGPTDFALNGERLP